MVLFFTPKKSHVDSGPKKKDVSDTVSAARTLVI